MDDGQGVLIADRVHDAAFGQNLDVDGFIQLLKSEIRTGKRAIVTDAMELTQEDASVLVPVSGEYESESAEIGDGHFELLRQHSANVDSMTNDAAGNTMRELISEWERPCLLVGH